MKIKFFALLLLCSIVPALVFSQNRVRKPNTVATNKTTPPKKVAKTASASQTTHTPKIKTFTVNGVSFDMVEVKGGKFLMGYHGVAQGPDYNKCKPCHEVTLSDFYIGKMEVTQELWEAVMGSNPCEKPNKLKPVNMVSYNECKEFAQKLSDSLGVSFCLPTEAQWEYAALGGVKSHNYTYSGGNYIDDVAVHSGNSSGPMRCGMMEPNELGLYDMSGNVSEFTIDRSHIWDSEPLTDPIYDNLKMPYAIVKGGNYASRDWPCRVYWRSMAQIDGWSPQLGFRLAMNIKK